MVSVSHNKSYQIATNLQTSIISNFRKLFENKQKKKVREISNFWKNNRNNRNKLLPCEHRNSSRHKICSSHLILIHIHIKSWLNLWFSILKKNQLHISSKKFPSFAIFFLSLFIIIILVVTNFRNILSYFISHHWKGPLTLATIFPDFFLIKYYFLQHSCMKGHKKDIHKMEMLLYIRYFCTSEPFFMLSALYGKLGSWMMML